jgi:hypothetical protein
MGWTSGFPTQVQKSKDLGVSHAYAALKRLDAPHEPVLLTSGALLGSLGLSWGSLGISWGSLGRSWAVLGSLVAILSFLGLSWPCKAL